MQRLRDACTTATEATVGNRSVCVCGEDRQANNDRMEGDQAGIGRWTSRRVQWDSRGAARVSHPPALLMDSANILPSLANCFLLKRWGGFFI